MFWKFTRFSGIVENVPADSAGSLCIHPCLGTFESCYCAGLLLLRNSSWRRSFGVVIVMKILLLAPQPFMTLRGTPIAIKMLAEALGSRGDHVDILTLPDGDDVSIPNCRIFRIPAFPGLRNVRPGFSLRKLMADVVMLPVAGRRMAGGDYDLVIAVEEAVFLAMMLGRIFNVPYIADVDSSMPEQLGDKFSLPVWLRRRFDRCEAAALKRAIGAITCCRALEELVRKQAPGVPVRTLEDVTMLDPMHRTSAPEDCRFEEPVVMYVGNLEAYQGVDLLIESMAALDSDVANARLVIIGGNKDHLVAARRRADELGIGERATFLGPRPLAELGDYLSAATICVSPRTQGRNTPMKIYSYLDGGCPLLATNLPTHTQVLDSSIAMLVEPNAADMARGLSRLLRDPALRQSLSEAARERVVAEFSPEAFRRKLDAFLSDVIEPRLQALRPERTANLSTIASKDLQ